jgi:DnaA family protein
LALTLAPHARFETFVPGSNATALRHVTELAAGARETLWLWGSSGCGKSHLLQAACRAADLGGRRAMYIELDRDGGVHPEILNGLEAIELLALDQIERVAGEPHWEQRLFGVLNAFLGRQGSLLLAARLAPGAAGLALPDLASRAGGAVIYRLESLGDADQISALVGHARARGLELDKPAAEYLLHRVTRDMTGLAQWLERLDRASLIAQRKLTIPFIRELLVAESSGGECCEESLPFSLLERRRQARDSRAERFGNLCFILGQRGIPGCGEMGRSVGRAAGASVEQRALGVGNANDEHAVMQQRQHHAQQRAFLAAVRRRGSGEDPRRFID